MVLFNLIKVLFKLVTQISERGRVEEQENWKTRDYIHSKKSKVEQNTEFEYTRKQSILETLIWHLLRKRCLFLDQRGSTKRGIF